MSLKPTIADDEPDGVVSTPRVRYLLRDRQACPSQN
jgi:hypothetical protein